MGCSDMLCFMEQMTSQIETEAPAASTLRSLYFLSHVNPEVLGAGQDGLQLAELSVAWMEELKLDIAPEYRQRLLGRYREKVESLIEIGTYTSLTAAVHFANDNNLGSETVSNAWYARDDYKGVPELSADELNAYNMQDYTWYLTDRLTLSKSTREKKELEIAWELAKNGFEGVDDTLVDRYEHRLQLVGNVLKNRNYSSRIALADDYTSAEHEILIKKKLPEHVQTYHSYAAFHYCLQKFTGLSDETKAKLVQRTVEFSESIAEAGFVNLNADKQRTLLLTAVVADLSEFDPENKKYAGWKKQLIKHFSPRWYNLAQLSYSSDDKEYALHNLGSTPAAAMSQTTDQTV